MKKMSLDDAVSFWVCLGIAAFFLLAGSVSSRGAFVLLGSMALVAAIFIQIFHIPEEQDEDLDVE